MRKFNYFLWLFILLFLVSVFFYLIISQDIILYLAPRMVPMLAFGSVVLLILFIHQLIGIKNSDDNHKSSFNIKYLLFMVPIVLFVTVMPDESMVNGMSNQSVTIPYLSGVVSNSTDEIGKKTYGTRKPPNQLGVAEVEIEQNDDNINLGVMDIEPCILTMDGLNTQNKDQFKELFSADVMDMVGEKISLKGFVFKYDILGKNTIIVARKVVSCCIADAYIVGYPVRVESSSDFETDEWVELSGVISKTELSPENGSSEYPIIVGGEIKKLDVPPLDELYVYP